MKRSAAITAALLACVSVARAAPPVIVVSRAWSRPAHGTAVVYATFRNSGSVADRLVGASSPLALHVGLHESFETKTAAMSMPMGNMPGGAMEGMKTVSSIPVPAGGTTMLEPGGYHLMLDLRHDIRAGETVPLRLHFARAGWITVNVPVKPIE
jgi:copper(I)-binding protein